MPAAPASSAPMQVGSGLGAWLGCGQQRPHVPSGAGSFRLLPHHTHHPHNAQAHAAVARRFAAAAVASNQMGCHRLCCLVLAWLASRWRPACAVQQAASWATSCIVPSAVHVAQHVVHASYLARSHIPNPQSGPATWRSCARPCPSWSAAACGRPARCAGYDSLFNIVPCTGCTLCTLGSCPTAFGCRSQRCCAPFALALLGSQPAAADGSCTVFFFSAGRQGRCQVPALLAHFPGGQHLRPRRNGQGAILVLGLMGTALRKLQLQTESWCRQLCGHCMRTAAPQALARHVSRLHLQDC